MAFARANLRGHTFAPVLKEPGWRERKQEWHDREYGQTHRVREVEGLFQNPFFINFSVHSFYLIYDNPVYYYVWVPAFIHEHFAHDIWINAYTMFAARSLAFHLPSQLDMWHTHKQMHYDTLRCNSNLQCDFAKIVHEKQNKKKTA